MFEESVSVIPSIWASMNSWFTPTVLFVFLNLMIGTIAISSSLATQKTSSQQKQQQQQQQQQGDYGHDNQEQQQQGDYGHDNQEQQQFQQQQQLVRSPSMLQRLKSVNFYNYRSPESSTKFAQTPGTDARFTSSHLFNCEQAQEQGQEEREPQPQLGRSPSILLQRLKSINLYNYLSQESPSSLDKTLQAAAETHYNPKEELDQEKERQQQHHLEPEQDQGENGGENEEEEEEDHFQVQEQSSFDEIYRQLKGSRGATGVTRTKSDTKPASGEILKKLPKKMKKSASSRSAFSHFKEEDVVEVESRRPATVRESGNVKEADDEGVDAKADDFINKFKHQLKLQRIDSIIRYKEMINRGSEK